VPDHDHLTSPNLGGVDRFASEQRKVDKPWGHELIFAVTDRYAGKLIFVRAGESLSLQFHNVKDEAWYILEGRAEVELGAPGERMLASEVVGPGAAFRFPPGTVHRVQAVEDTTILEVSTPELEDVIRLEDRYGRAGS
jgi:mannose-6-phosphate isomerase-like protein (cupin superfamily)